MNELSPPETLEELLEKHEAKVRALRARVEKVIPRDGSTTDGVIVDDVFLLRFVLSNEDVEVAAGKVQETLKWRQENSKLLTALSKGKPHPLDEDMSRFLFTGVTGRMEGGEPVSVTRMGLSDFRKLLINFNQNVIAGYLLYEKEKMFRICDEETRKRNRIVKAITVIDFAGFSMFGGRFDNRFFNCLAASSKLSSTHFPQLQAKTVSINTPSYFGMVHRTLSATMPKSSMDKMVMCAAKRTEKKSAAECPFMSRFGGVQAVPPFLGGTAQLPAKLTPPNKREGELPFQSMKIANRFYALVELPIEHPDTIVEFEVECESFHVLMTAELAPMPMDEGEFEDEEEEQEEMGNSPSNHRVSYVSMSRKERRRNKKGKQAKGKRNAKQRQRSARLVSPNDQLAAAASQRRFSMNPRMAPIRLDSKDGMIKGTWKVPSTGRLFVKFDNTFSIFRSKKVTFRITTVPPPEDPEEQEWWEANWTEFANLMAWPGRGNNDWGNCTIS